MIHCNRNYAKLKANIVGPSDLYVKTGSDINLTCRILQGPHELGNIFWYKGTEIVDSTTNQNELDSGMRISVENDWTDGLTSRLKIRRAMPSDTGNYTCVPTIAKSASVYVHVIIGEHPAAMQHNSSSINSSNFYASLCCLLFTIFTCCIQQLCATVTIQQTTKAATAARNTATKTTTKTVTSAATTAKVRKLANETVVATTAKTRIISLSCLSTKSSSSSSSSAATATRVARTTAAAALCTPHATHTTTTTMLQCNQIACASAAR